MAAERRRAKRGAEELEFGGWLWGSRGLRSEMIWPWSFWMERRKSGGRLHGWRRRALISAARDIWRLKPIRLLALLHEQFIIPLRRRWHRFAD